MNTKFRSLFLLAALFFSAQSCGLFKSKPKLEQDRRKGGNRESTATGEDGKKYVRLPLPAMKWVLKNQFDADGLPTKMAVKLIAGGDPVFIDSTTFAEEIFPAHYDQFGIPDHAIMACGGHYAGLGEYFYVERLENTLLVWETYQDEGMEPDENGIVEEPDPVLKARIKIEDVPEDE